MTTDQVAARGPKALRRNAIWPWLLMPVIILALFLVLHNVRRSGDASDQGSSLGRGIP